MKFSALNGSWKLHSIWKGTVTLAKYVGLEEVVEDDVDELLQLTAEAVG